jgi:hypothetical protein
MLAIYRLWIVDNIKEAKNTVNANETFTKSFIYGSTWTLSTTYGVSPRHGNVPFFSL